MNIRYITNGTLALKPVRNYPGIKAISSPRKNRESLYSSICQQMFGYLHEQGTVSSVQKVLKGEAVPNLFGDAGEKRFVRVACTVSVVLLFLLSFVSF